MSLKPPVTSLDHIHGNKSAPVELVEFGDYQCPHCGKAFPVIKQLQKAMGTKMKFIYRNFPLQEVHPYAMDAALAAEAAGLQHKFWQMHDALFENQRDLSPENIMLIAEDLALDTDNFLDDIRNPGIVQKVESDIESGVNSGVTGTPTFFVNGEKYTGSFDLDSLYSFLKDIK